MKPVSDLLKEFIAIPSVNPAFLAPKDPRAGEQQLATFIAHIAKRAGLEVQWQKVFPQRSNLLVRYPARGKPRRRVILAPHLDTVGCPEMSPVLFQPRTEGGRIYGRGACDTKGSIAGMLTALLRLASDRGRRPEKTEILLTAFVDEESGQAGSRSFIQDTPPIDLAIVGEPTRLEIATAHKGAVWLKLFTDGKAAHGARPELGRNAVHQMARAIDLLETAYASGLKKRAHHLLGPPTINVGYIRGGTQPNIVPAECLATIDRRTLPGETHASVVRELRILFKSHALKLRFAPLQNSPCLPMETDPSHPLIQHLLKMGRKKKSIGVHYFSDASVLCQRGVPSVLFGPGNIAQAHTADEWVSRKQLEKASDILTSFLRSLP